MESTAETSGVTLDADVIVVGGGVSGMAAANVLHQEGRSVVVLEARARVGGRTYSKPAPEGLEGTVEYGGMHIGETHYRSMELGRSLGLEISPPVDHGVDLYLIDGKLIQLPDGELPDDLDFSAELKSSLAELDKLAESIGYEAPWDAPNAAELDSMTAATWIDQNVKHPLARLVHKMAVNFVMGSSPEETSMLYWAYYIVQCEGLDNFFATHSGAQNGTWIGGANQLTQRIADRLGPSVRLESPVHAIVQHDDIVEVHTSEGVVRGRRAILAMAPNAADRLRFDPPLPYKRRQLQMRSPMARQAKIVTRYAKPFWFEKGLSGGLIDCDRLGAFAMDATKASDNCGTLVGFISGSYHDTWAEMSEEEQREKYLSLLTDALGPEAADPIFYHVVNWEQEYLTKGAPVTFMPPAVMTSYGSALRGRAGNILIAGTEASLKWSGYMEGAVCAGQDAAKQILSEL